MKKSDMSWLLFMDESGHDHMNCPCEVRGGFAIHTRRIWDFHQDFRKAEKASFGKHLSDFVAEIGSIKGPWEVKGSKILARKKFKWAEYEDPLPDAKRHQLVWDFLSSASRGVNRTRLGFAAYGQASLQFADRIFALLKKHEATVFASMIPRGVRIPGNHQFDELLRKDHTFLLERFFYFLELHGENGLLILDQTEKQQDRKFIDRLHGYFTKTRAGRQRTQWIVPSPLFVASDLSPAIQAADVCIYTINWGFRPQAWRLQDSGRQEISRRYGRILHELQFRGTGYQSGSAYKTFGIFHLPDPYTNRTGIS